MNGDAILKSLAVSIAAAAFALSACARPDDKASSDPAIFNACAEAAVFETDAVKGNEAGSALAIGNDPAFITLNGTSLTLSRSGDVTAEGPYAKEALKEYRACALSFKGGMS